MASSDVPKTFTCIRRSPRSPGSTYGSDQDAKSKKESGGDAINHSDGEEKAAEASDEDEGKRCTPKKDEEMDDCSGNPASSAADDRAASSSPSLLLPVQHECFGLARGWLEADKYTSPSAKCIKCYDCRKWNSGC